MGNTASGEPLLFIDCYGHQQRTMDELGKHCWIHDWYNATLYLLPSSKTEKWKKKEQLMSKDFYGMTCLHSACAKNMSRDKHAPKEVIKLMIDIGADDLLMEKDNYCDYTPLQMLAYDQNTNIEMMKILLELGGGKELIKKSGYSHGYTMLHELSMQSAQWSWETDEPSLQRIKLILDYTGKELLFARTEKNGRTPLHLACMERAPVNVINMLVEAGGEELVLLTDNDGLTALHFLCYDIDEDIDGLLKIAILLNCCGSKLLPMKTNDLRTALDFAKEEGASQEILEALGLKKKKKLLGKAFSKEKTLTEAATCGAITSVQCQA